MPVPQNGTSCDPEPKPLTRASPNLDRNPNPNPSSLLSPNPDFSSGPKPDLTLGLTPSGRTLGHAGLLRSLLQLRKLPHCPGSSEETGSERGSLGVHSSYTAGLRRCHLGAATTVSPMEPSGLCRGACGRGPGTASGGGPALLCGGKRLVLTTAVPSSLLSPWE